MTDYIVIVTVASHLKTFWARDVLSALPGSLTRFHREVVELDTTPFHDDTDGGDWAAEERYIRQRAEEVARQCGGSGFQGCFVFALAEVPSLIALGAFLGDRIKFTLVDWDRDRGQWLWPEGGATVEFVTIDLPTEVVRSSEPVVVRIECSAPITNEQIAPMVGRQLSADVRIVPKAPAHPRIALLRSEADLDGLRSRIREVIAGLSRTRPFMEELHLFVAASCSGSIVCGQELQLRNANEVLTYRYRPGREAEPYSEGILLREWETDAPIAVSHENQTLAATLRHKVWAGALDDVRAFAQELRLPGEVADWRATLTKVPWLLGLPWLPTLPPLYSHLDVIRDSVSLTPYNEREYGFDAGAREWRFRDDTLLGLWDAADKSEPLAGRAARLFFFHEYLHDHQGLTKLAATQVGSFPNVLERIDYVADLYALVHQLELLWRQGEVQSEDHARRLLVDQIDLVLRSIWAFQGRRPIRRIQERSLRRLLNWYWRQAQVRRAPDLRTALTALSRHPAIEVSGLVHQAGARRVYVRLNRLDRTTDLAVGLVTEDGVFDRVVSQAAADIQAMVRALCAGDHDAIQVAIGAVMEQVGPPSLPCCNW